MKEININIESVLPVFKYEINGENFSIDIDTNNVDYESISELFLKSLEDIVSD